MSEQIETYSKINDLQGIRAMGDAIAKSGMFGCEKTEQGIVLALQCIAENKPPLEMAKHYHLVKGKLTKRADAALAEFLSIGGKFTFADLKDSTSQRATVTYGDYKDFSVEYTIEDAKSQGLLDGSNPNWKTRPAAMMRARLVTETLRAVAPQVIAGFYEPDEVTEFVEREKRQIEKHVESSVNLHKKKPEPDSIDAEIVEETQSESSTLESLIGDRGEQVTAYFAKKKKINAELGETWKDLPQDEQDALLCDFENFEKAILIGGAK